MPVTSASVTASGLAGVLLHCIIQSLLAFVACIPVLRQALLHGVLQCVDASAGTGQGSGGAACTGALVALQVRGSDVAGRMQTVREQLRKTSAVYWCGPTGYPVASRNCSTGSPPRRALCCSDTHTWSTHWDLILAMLESLEACRSTVSPDKFFVCRGSFQPRVLRSLLPPQCGSASDPDS